MNNTLAPLIIFVALSASLLTTGCDSNDTLDYATKSRIDSLTALAHARVDSSLLAFCNDTSNAQVNKLVDSLYEKRLEEINDLLIEPLRAE